MSLQFNHLKNEARKVIKGLTEEEIVGLILHNNLSLKFIRDNAIKEEYYYLLKNSDLNIKDIYFKLSNTYDVKNRMLRLIITGT